MFVLDIFVPLPIGATILYVPLLLFAARLGSSKLVWWCFAESIALMFLAALIVPRVPVTHPTQFAMNRIGIAAINLVVAWLAIAARKSSIVSQESAHAIQQSEREFRDLAENLPDVITRFDRQFRHVYVNRVVHRYTGMPPETFLGKDHVDLHMPADLVGLWQEKIQKVFETGLAESFEFTYTSLEGPRHFECRLVPEFSAEGIVQTVLGINRDLTDIIHAQEQAQAHLAQLAHVSRLSTLGSLVSEISHEINQPLHAIVNYSEASLNVLETSGVDKKSTLANWLKQICDQAKRAAEIIRRSNQFVRKSPVRRSTVDVNQLIRDCLRLENLDLRAHRIKLTCDLAKKLPCIIADTIQIQQVLINLLRNAVEAMTDMPESDRRLLIRSESIDSCVQISVRDNGVGISEEQAERLFEPFFTTKQEGMGMGLAVSQAIVAAHSGQLTTEPNADRGMTFYLTLPVSRENSHEYCHA